MPAPVDIDQAFRDHGHHVQRRAARILGDHEEAREVLQDVFTLLLERPGAFRGQSALSSWLYGVTTRLCLNRIRKRCNRRRLRALFLLPAEEACAASSEQRAQVREILSQVPDELAQVAIYHYLDEMSHAEIASVIGCARRTVGSMLDRFHCRVRRMEEAA
jgi:RNA polymerase sigma-70 factor (ECF subfamily)